MKSVAKQTISHILKINDTNKHKILNYFKELNDHNRENDYLKGLIIPTNIKRRRKSGNEGKNQNLKHSLILLKLKMKEKKICKNAFIQLHQIKRSRLEKKVQKNRDISLDMRGMHENRWNQLPQEIADDVTGFIKDLPVRESHYSPKTQGNRKYLSYLNISKLHRNFISL